VGGHIATSRLATVVCRAAIAVCTLREDGLADDSDITLECTLLPPWWSVHIHTTGNFFISFSAVPSGQKVSK